jgi:pimeloyl-ACP methyl ester carboxylesterase
MTHLLSPEGRRLAYRLTPGRAPGVAFLGGFRSDMMGTKALHLEAWARAKGQAFLRFDYSGHGESGGAFEEGTIGDWLADARAALTLLPGPHMLVGSSMGGWLALLLARERPETIAGLVTIAAAPDFTETLWAEFGPEARAELLAKGLTHRPSEYGDPHPIAQRLIQEARAHLVLAKPLRLPFPTRFLQGAEDRDVPPETALRLLAHAEGSDLRLILLKGADHRFSAPEALAVLAASVEEVLARAMPGAER